MTMCRRTHVDPRYAAARARTGGALRPAGILLTSLILVAAGCNAEPSSPPAVQYSASALYVYIRSSRAGDDHVPVELLVTDPVGRRTGIDPASGLKYEEIPSSTYGIEQIADDEDATAQPSPAVKSLEVLTPMSGTYLVDVIGAGEGSYALDVIGEDIHAEPSRVTLTGTASAGSRARYKVNYSSASGARITVRQVPK